MNFDIFVDSAANLTDEMISSYGIKVIPYICTVNGEERFCYEDGMPFEKTAKRFYEDMVAGADVKTSLIGEERFAEALTPTLQAGRDALLITITSSLSGTYNQAINAQKALAEKFPKNKVYVIDSANASLGEGLLAVQAAKLRDMGETCETCAKRAEENKYKINSYVTVDDLKYLKKSGRVSTVMAIAGTILNIKPMLKADGNVPARLSTFAKERGRRKSIEALANHFSENVIDPENQTVAICHCNCIEDAEKLAAMVKERGAKEVVLNYYDLCTGSHVGPGTVALFFTGKDRLAPATEAHKAHGKAAAQKI